ncbi:hypothetical protein NQ314_011346 [Rhamnusium bicolor]|uniref:Uncharacterized protein n=1 Tax=Rhamnusium bicolor TaxID=1586634 RepID=A0AAV8XJL0_9CUCU|nr:hypothetical protein NQ314_011346 [Rhamnusium bicolor]
MFDNMAFYNSVSVIAGRAIVTIDPLPEKDSKLPVVQQPRRLKWQEQIKNNTKNEDPFRSVQSARNDAIIKKSLSFENMLNKAEDPKELTENVTKSENSLAVPRVEVRKKSLKERRMSKSLYLKIDFPKELPIIRQHSMPKFYLDTPEENQTESTLIKTPMTALQSPMVKKEEFSYDLYSVVQIEKTKNQENAKEVIPIHRSPSKLSQIKGKIKLRKSKSTVSSSNIPHSNYI